MSEFNVIFGQATGWQLAFGVVLGGRGILNLISVSVFSRPKTEVMVSLLVLALIYVKIRKSAQSAFYSPGPHLATGVLRFRVITKWRLFIQKNVRPVALLKINDKNCENDQKLGIYYNQKLGFYELGSVTVSIVTQQPKTN